ncbi:MAG: hypothetical protein OXC72_13320 [Roseovarius sp.]|nr:hypothetical protein [Roseovarius sp.]MCY4292720.1 hypothetical protein [Roseovarius sp.]
MELRIRANSWVTQAERFMRSKKCWSTRVQIAIGANEKLWTSRENNTLF